MLIKSCCRSLSAFQSLLLLMHLPEKSTLFRHRIISFLRDIDVRGIRRLSVALPALLLAHPGKVGKHIRQTLHGVKLIIDPANDSGVELSVYQTGTYEKGTIQLLQQFLKPGSTFVDIGANIGLMSAIASHTTGQSGKVIAIEPNPETISILRENLLLNACTNVQILEVGLAAEAGEAVLFENRHVNRGGASLINQSRICDPLNRSHDVQLSTLDEVCKNEQIALVKIDVEGFELEVLKGGANTLRRDRPVIIVEVSAAREGQNNPSPADVYRFLDQFGIYRFFRQKGTKERRSKLVEICDESDLPTHDNLVCIPLKATDF